MIGVAIDVIAPWACAKILGVPMSSYVAQLRALVGNELLHFPSAAVLCRDAQGRVLLVRQRESGNWSTPGGAIEPGEAPEAAAVREAYEETGLDVEINGLRTALGGPEFCTTFANGDRLSYVALVYDATVVGGEPTPDNDETSAVEWVTLEELALLPKENFLSLLLARSVLV